MLASTGIEFDPAKNYDERKETYRMSGKIVKPEISHRSARRGDKNGLWTTVVAAAVFIL